MLASTTSRATSFLVCKAKPGLGLGAQGDHQGHNRDRSHAGGSQFTSIYQRIYQLKGFVCTSGVTGYAPISGLLRVEEHLLDEIEQLSNTMAIDLDRSVS